MSDGIDTSKDGGILEITINRPKANAIDLRASRRFAVRLIEADYLLTTFDNGTNNHQNNLRVSAGVVLHF